MTFFLFLFFGVFFALLLIGIQSSSGLRLPNHSQSINPAVGKQDVEKFGDVEQIENVILALQKRGETLAYTGNQASQNSVLAYNYQALKEDVEAIKVQLFAFKLIVSGFAFVFGFAAAFFALTGEIKLP
ncbi:hypothetical protein [uncultured Tateyamaria sp.]|uniref:hypothetical protein n=1 Tax=uncultured Tateyamaria sp. TaxID=455651 RepID=UPI002629186E|nr:hypothetical protein [uncultured Tateyamaria sp.]